MKKLLQSRKKGFTLVELIVVIVIIAILIAALTPAILGVIRRANTSANQADARVILTAAQTFAIGPDGAIRALTRDGINAAIQPGGLAGLQIRSATIYVEQIAGAAAGVGMPVGVSVPADSGRNADAVTIGTTTVGGNIVLGLALGANDFGGGGGD